jgi:hypothetical protein
MELIIVSPSSFIFITNVLFFLLKKGFFMTNLSMKTIENLESKLPELILNSHNKIIIK